MNDEIRLTISGLVYNKTVVNTYGLVMQEKEGNRRFSIIIGEPEAQSIALKMNNRTLTRPLTHDLIKNILISLKADLKKIVIYDLVNEIFYSEIYIENSDKELIKIEARTSDSVALAVRADCPIYIKREILDIVGAEIEIDSENEKKSYSYENIDSLSIEELGFFSEERLEDFLDQAVAEEKYELAVKIRNALENKKNENIGE